MSLEKELKSQVVNYVQGRIQEDDKEEILVEASKILGISAKELEDIIENDNVSTMEYRNYEVILQIIGLKPEIYFES